MESVENIQQVIKGCQRNEYQWQKELYDRFSAHFYALCYRYLGDKEEAQDALIEGFRRVFKHIETYRGESGIEAWMRQIFVRLLAKRQRKLRQEQTRVNYCETLDDKSAVTDDSHQSADLKYILEESMLLLSHEQRIIFNLVAIEGYNLDEAAEICNIHVSSLKRRYYKARDILKEALIKKGINCE